MQKRLLIALVLISTLAAAQAVPAFADHDRHGGPGPGRSPGPEHWCGWGPGGKALFWTSFGLEVGALTLGTIVSYLPPGHTIVYIGGAPYYYYGGTYYVVVPGSGYMVVNPTAAPVVVQQPAPVVAQQPTTTQVVIQQPAAASPVATAPQTVSASSSSVQAAPKTSSSEKYDVYLPNGNGTFTVVPLSKTPTGFLGPQGEFYQDHPTVDQLRERYLQR